MSRVHFLRSKVHKNTIHDHFLFLLLYDDEAFDLKEHVLVEQKTFSHKAAAQVLAQVENINTFLEFLLMLTRPLPVEGIHSVDFLARATAPRSGVTLLIEKHSGCCHNKAALERNQAPAH